MTGSQLNILYRDMRDECARHGNPDEAFSMLETIEDEYMSLLSEKK